MKLNSAMPSLDRCLLNSDNDVRSGWKFAAYIVLFLMLWVATVFVLGGIGKWSGEQLLGFTLSLVTAGSPTLDNLLNAKQLLQVSLNAIALIIPAVGATLLLARVVDRVPASQFVGFSGWAAKFAGGAAIGAALLAVLMTGFAAFGQVSVGAGTGRFGARLFVFAVLAVSAANEELAFRGYAMQSLAKGIGRWPAAAVTAGLFGLLHARNPNVSWVGIMNTVLAGMLLAAAYYKAQSLWLPYGIHLIWNAGLGMVLGFPVSGLNFVSFWRTSADGADLLIGGEYGPEGGLMGTLVFVAGWAGIQFLRFRKPPEKAIIKA